MKEIVTWSLSVNPENYHYPQTNRDWQRLRLLGIIFPDDCKISGVHQSFAAICLQTKFEAEKMRFNSDWMKSNLLESCFKDQIFFEGHTNLKQSSTVQRKVEDYFEFLRPSQNGRTLKRTVKLVSNLLIFIFYVHTTRKCFVQLQKKIKVRCRNYV